MPSPSPTTVAPDPYLPQLHLEKRCVDLPLLVQCYLTSLQYIQKVEYVTHVLCYCRQPGQWWGAIENRCALV